MLTVVLCCLLPFGVEDTNFKVFGRQGATKPPTVVKATVDNPDLTIKIFGNKGTACNATGCTQFDLDMAEGTHRRIDTRDHLILIYKKNPGATVQSTPAGVPSEIIPPPGQAVQQQQGVQYYQQPVQYYQQPMMMMGGNCATGNCSGGS